MHIRRRNRLRRLLSQVRAELTGEFVAGPPQERRPRVRVRLDWHDCVKDFELREVLEATAERAFRSCDVLELTYEEVAADFGAALRRLQGHLGLPPLDLPPPLRRQGGDPLPEAIENYDELLAQARGTPYEWFFEESADS
jgi:LPS sulfotransferase NodH